MAYLDDGEMLRTPDGTIGSIPEEGKPTDSNLLNVPVGTQVLSDKIKVPGTNKTFAEMGKKLMKKSNKKANNIYAENIQAFLCEKFFKTAKMIENRRLKGEKTPFKGYSFSSGVLSRLKVLLRFSSSDCMMSLYFSSTFTAIIRKSFFLSRSTYCR